MDRDWVLHVLDTISGFSCGENGITRLALSEEEKTKVYFASLVKEKQDRLNKLKSDYEGLQKEIEEIVQT